MPVDEAKQPGLNADEDSGFNLPENWANAWKASLSTKITSIVLWGIALIAFAIAVLMMWNGERKLEQSIEVHADRLSYLVSLALSRTSKNTQISELLPEKLLFDDNDISAFSIKIDEAVFRTGGRSDEDTKLSRKLVFSFADDPLRVRVAELEICYHPISKLLRNQQRKILLTTVALCLFFGMFLSWTMNKVVSYPFEKLIKNAQYIYHDNLSARFDARSYDEFGEIALFFNRLLDQLTAQQTALGLANQDLMEEVEVRKRAEENLLNHRNELEKTVEKRTEDLKLAMREAMAANEAKSTFIANMSHEIRTPLTAIVGFTESLLQDTSESSKHAGMLSVVLRNGRHLLQIVDDILDLSKIEADHLEVEWLEFSLLEFLAETVSLEAANAQSKGIELRTRCVFPLPDRIRSDPTRLRQILLNLLANAVKFTNEGWVELSVRFDSKAENLVFAIQDTGIGIDLESAEPLFQPFKQADASTTRKYGGTGLGLSISQELARLLGGSIQLESSLGNGSLFRVLLPAGDLSVCSWITQDTAAVRQNIELTRQSIQHLNGNILVAEDNLDNQELLSLLLVKSGLMLTIVNNGQEAIEYALARHPDLILMDIQMPVMDGMAAVKSLRKQNYTGPIIALTANVMKQQVDAYLSMGFSDWLAKPIDVSRLYRTVEFHLHQPKKGVAGQNGNGSIQDSLYDTEEFKVILKKFKGNLLPNFDKLKQFVEQSDWEGLTILAHGVKGAAANYGLHQVADAALQVEMAAVEKNSDQVNEQMIKLKELIEEVLK